MSSFSTTRDAMESGLGGELSDLELAILRATEANSLSTVAIAEHVGLERDPAAILAILDRLEGLALLDGYYAAGRVMASVSEVHRKYYRVSERGRQLVC
jgi:hypothetical protein